LAFSGTLGAAAAAAFAGFAMVVLWHSWQARLIRDSRLCWFLLLVLLWSLAAGLCCVVVELELQHTPAFLCCIPARSRQRPKWALILHRRLQALKKNVQCSAACQLLSAVLASARQSPNLHFAACSRKEKMHLGVRG